MNGRSRTVKFDGTKVQTTMKANADAEPATTESTLSTVPFLGDAADVVISAMKLKQGMRFMLPVYSQGPDVEWQTFGVTGQEDFKTAKGSVPVWVVKQSGAAMTGTLYTADEPPYLFRWIFEFKNGNRITIDQELIDSKTIGSASGLCFKGGDRTWTQSVQGAIATWSAVQTPARIWHATH